MHPRWFELSHEQREAIQEEHAGQQFRRGLDHGLQAFRAENPAGAAWADAEDLRRRNAARVRNNAARRGARDLAIQREAEAQRLLAQQREALEMERVALMAAAARYPQERAAGAQRAAAHELEQWRLRGPALREAAELGGMDVEGGSRRKRSRKNKRKAKKTYRKRK
jgi:hypothetical protein